MVHATVLQVLNGHKQLEYLITDESDIVSDVELQCVEARVRLDRLWTCCVRLPGGSSSPDPWVSLCLGKWPGQLLLLFQHHTAEQGDVLRRQGRELRHDVSGGPGAECFEVVDWRGEHDRHLFIHDLRSEGVAHVDPHYALAAGGGQQEAQQAMHRRACGLEVGVCDGARYSTCS